jgi:hypothetical protein
VFQQVVFDFFDDLFSFFFHVASIMIGTGGNVKYLTGKRGASGGQGALFEKTAPWTPAKAFY